MTLKLEGSSVAASKYGKTRASIKVSDTYSRKEADLLVELLREWNPEVAAAIKLVVDHAKARSVVADITSVFGASDIIHLRHGSHDPLHARCGVDLIGQPSHGTFDRAKVTCQTCLGR